MQHPDEGTIHSWLDGALSAEEAARVEAHVKECAQCQAAVAEARGFIAASSRILTALDNAPRGVIPAAKPAKRMDPMVWRIAATVLVVAAGTLVVVRNSGLTRRASEESAARVTLADTPVITAQDRSAADSVTVSKTSAMSAPTATSQSDFSGKPVLAGATPAQRKRPAPRVDEKKADAAGLLGRRAGNAESNNAAVAVAPPAAATPLPAPPTAPRFEALRTQIANGAASMDAMAAEPRIRVVGHPRSIGQRLTLYEVTPGDTVLFAEPASLALQSVVTTGAATTSQRAMAAPAREKQSATAKLGAAAADTGRITAAQAPASVPAMAPTFTTGADGTNTLAWRDTTNGNLVTLSGRHTRAELEQLRRIIERMKAAAADSVKKNR